ncbi:hypothetical protein F5Y12DRAFT_342653 [Xylaria sp. FL1777]|nr:hypothetical protein F5Y12DRAFT_342653 [Xylaria sp. FL1777]
MRRWMWRRVSTSLHPVRTLHSRGLSIWSGSPIQAYLAWSGVASSAKSHSIMVGWGVGLRRENCCGCISRRMARHEGSVARLGRHTARSVWLGLYMAVLAVWAVWAVWPARNSLEIPVTVSNSQDRLQFLKLCLTKYYFKTKDSFLYKIITVTILRKKKVFKNI